MFRAIKQHVTGTYYGKQRHGMARQPTVRRHVYEGKNGKTKFIGCMYH